MNTTPIGEDRFEVLRTVGRGASGLVQEVRDRQRGGRVALKRLHRDGAMDVVRLREEFRSLSDVLHPHLVRLHEMIVDDDQTLVTMDLVEGGSFLEYVWDLTLLPTASPTGESWPTMDPAGLDDEPAAAAHAASPPLTEALVERLRTAMRGLVEGVSALHAVGLLHRDLKPSNVLVESDGHVVLVDFGLTVREGTSPTSLAGTVPYMAPEQLNGESLGAASDWYAVGVILYEALTGRTPFTGSAAQIAFDKQIGAAPPVSELAADAPPDLALLCARLLERDPTTRLSGDEVRAALGVDHQASSPATPFVGRGAVLHMLRDFLAADGLRMVRIAGSSGMGKTRLVEHVLSELGPDTLVLAGRCYEREQAPFKAIDPVVNSLVRALLTEPLSVTLPVELSSAAHLFPSLRPLAGPRVSDPADPVQLRRRAVSALRELMYQTAEQRQTVLWIDDLQWADLASMRILASLITREPVPQLAIILAHRDDDPSLDELLAPIVDLDATVVTLEPLPDADAVELAAVHLGTDQARIDQVLAEANGSPFFLSEISQWLATELAPTGDLLGDVIQSRVDLLPTSARRLLEVVAVAGRPLQPSVALRATRASEPDSSAGDVATLTVQRLLTTRRGTALECTHDRFREALTANLSSERSATIHEHLAHAIGTDGPAEVLSEHWEGAGDTPQAASYARIAAEMSEKTLDFERAAALYRRAISLGLAQPQEARIAMGHCMARAGMGDAAAVLLEAAAEASAGERTELERSAVNQMLRVGHFDEAYAWMPRVLKALGMSWPATRIGALAELMWNTARIEVPWLQGAPPSEQALDLTMELAMSLAYADMLRSAVFSTRSILMAQNSVRPHTRAIACAMRGSNAALLGDYRTSDRWLKVARDTLPEDAPASAAISIDLHQAIAETVVGDFEPAAKRLYAVVAFLERQGGRPYEVDMARTFLLFAVLQTGHVAEFRSMRARAIDLCHSRGAKHFEVFFRVAYALQPDLIDDRPDALAANLAEAESRWGEGTSTVWLYTETSWAQLDVYRGHHALALQRVERVYRTAKRNGLLNIVFNVTLLHCVRASAAAPLAATDASARKILDNAVKGLLAITSPFASCSAHTWQAAAHAVAGRQEQALESNQRALQAVAKVHVPWQEAMVNVQRAMLLGQPTDTANEPLRAMGARNPDALTALYAWAPPKVPA